MKQAAAFYFLHLPTVVLASAKVASSSAMVAKAAAAAMVELVLLTSHVPQARALTYNVVPDSGDESSSSSRGLNSIGQTFTLQTALDSARGGDTVSLADGVYTGQVHSIVSGTEGFPVRIVGGRGAVVKGSSPSVLVEHSWVTLQVRESYGGTTLAIVS